MATINERIREFFDDVTSDIEKQRVIEYVIREVHKGRRLMEVVEDPFVRNRMNEQKRTEVFENPEIIEALETEIRDTIAPPELGFSS